MIRKVLLILLVLIAVSLGVSSLLGIRPFVLRSSSMEPEYPSGSLIFADTKVSLDSLNIDDVIIYQGFAQELTRYQGSSRVKSDNASATVEITADQVTGRAVFSIPWIGNLVDIFLQHQYIAWVVIAGLFIYALLPRRLLPHISTEKVEQETDGIEPKKGDTL